MTTTFREAKLDDNRAPVVVFDFDCEACGAAGELTLPDPAFEPGLPFGCPKGCGATYVCWQDGPLPALMCVVRPVFE